jgi:ABC-type arginine/histidine transport system permease subunit
VVGQILIGAVDARGSGDINAAHAMGRLSVQALPPAKRIALRCEKTATNYGSFVALALGFILIKSVHTAQ